jgi:flavodoxin
MKKLIKKDILLLPFLLVVMTAFLGSSCSSAQKPDYSPQKQEPSVKSTNSSLQTPDSPVQSQTPASISQSQDSTSGNDLIVYLSRTNNTKAVAEMIQNYAGGTLVPLELVNPYPENYQAIVAQVAQENETGFLPPLKTKIDNIRNYDIVFLGFPTWGMELPPPMKSFLNQYDLSGKKVIPFNTNAGYGIGSSFETVKALCKNCNIQEGFSTRGGIERDGVYLAIKDAREKEVQAEVEKWLQKIGIQKK